MTDRDIVERVARIFDRAVTPLRVRKAHHKQPFATALKGTDAALLMQAVEPHMGPKRKAQILRALSSWHGRPARWRRSDLTCTAEACGRPTAVRGLCRQHYKGWWKAKRYGRRSTVSPIAPTSPLAFASDAARCTEGCGVAWLAGLLEGEGTFTTTRDRYLVYPKIVVKMTDEAVIAKASKIIGAPAVWRAEPRDPRWNVNFVAAVTGRGAARWMRELRPFMGLRRTAAIDAALAAYHPIRLTEPPAICVVSGCAAPHRSRGLCQTHYMSWSRDVARGRTPRVTPLR
jgi:hypothetical protein